MIARFFGFRPALLVTIVCLMTTMIIVEPSHAQQSTDGYFSGITRGLKSVTNFFTPSKSVPEPADDPISLSTESTPSPKLYMHIAEMFLRSGKPDLAEAHYLKALEMEPENLDARLELARLQSRVGKREEAMQNYSTAARMYPETPKVFNNLGAFYAQQRMFPEALAAFQKAIELDPKDPRSRNNIAIILIEMNRLSDAFHQLNAVHDESVAYYNIGFILFKKGELELSRRHFVTAVQRNPGFTQAQSMISQIDRARGIPEGGQPPMQNLQAGQDQQSLGAPQTEERPWWQGSGTGPVADSSATDGIRVANIPQPPQQQVAPQQRVPQQNVVRSLPPLSKTDFGPVQANPSPRFARQVQDPSQAAGRIPQVDPNAGYNQLRPGSSNRQIGIQPGQQLFPTGPSQSNVQPQGSNGQYYQSQPAATPQTPGHGTGQPYYQSTPGYNRGAKLEESSDSSTELQKAPMPPMDINVLPASYLSE